MRSFRYVLSAVVLGTGIAITFAEAQVVREEGVASLARLLDETVVLGLGAVLVDDFEFIGRGEQVLFATIDANIYQDAGRQHEEEAAGAAPPATGDEADTCGDDRRVHFCLQVLDSRGDVLCWAERPVNPGWQRDPRLACALPGAGRGGDRYVLRVSLADEDCGDLNYPARPQGAAMQALYYLLNVSLRNVAPEGALPLSVAQSRNRL